MMFPKKIALEYDLPCIISKEGISFSRKHDIFLWTENERWSFSKRHENMMLSVYSVKMVFVFPTNMKIPSCQKKQRGPSPEKYN